MAKGLNFTDFCFANKKATDEPHARLSPAPRTADPDMAAGPQRPPHLGAYPDGRHHGPPLGETAPQPACSAHQHPPHQALIPLRGILPSASPPRPSAASVATTAAVLLPALLRRHHVVPPIPPLPFPASHPPPASGPAALRPRGLFSPTSFLKVPPPPENSMWQWLLRLETLREGRRWTAPSSPASSSPAPHAEAMASRSSPLPPSQSTADGQASGCHGGEMAAAAWRLQEAR